MDGELPDVFDEKVVKARKEHVCCECKNQIKKGAKYSLFEGHWPDSGWQRFKTCMECDELRRELTDPDFGSAPFGYLSESAHDAGVEMPTVL